MRATFSKSCHTVTVSRVYFTVAQNHYPAFKWSLNESLRMVHLKRKKVCIDQNIKAKLPHQKLKEIFQVSKVRIKSKSITITKNEEVLKL